MPRRQKCVVYLLLSAHQATVLDAAISRLMPAASEAGVVSYSDRLLSLFAAQTPARGVRAAHLRDQYANGIALLDQLAGGDFAAVPRLRQDLVLSHTQVAPFATLLIDQLIEAIYAPPRHLYVGQCCQVAG